MPVASHHTTRSSLLQSSRITSDLWSSDIVPRLPPELDMQAHTLHALQRHRAFACATDLLRALLAYVLAPYSFAALGGWGVLHDIADISPTACANAWGGPTRGWLGSCPGWWPTLRLRCHSSMGVVSAWSMPPDCGNGAGLAMTGAST